MPRRCRSLAWFFMGNNQIWCSMSAALVFQNLTLGYDRLPAVQQLDTEIQEGSLTAIVGPNGAGKSTLLKGVTGALAPLEGKVHIDGSVMKKSLTCPNSPKLTGVFRSPLSIWLLWAFGARSGRSAD